MMTVIDVIHPHMSGASTADDHIEVTCVPSERVAIPKVTTPTLHPMMSTALALAADGQMSEAVVEALQLVEERIQSLMGITDPGHTLTESVFSVRPPPLDITTATGLAAEDEREGFRLLFLGVMRGLRDPRLRDPLRTGSAVPATVDETWEYLALASMLMRRLDRAERRLG
ncbi:MAG: TIGR02391 family protein [Pseudonocardiaceae bacterium]